MIVVLILTAILTVIVMYPFLLVMVVFKLDCDYLEILVERTIKMLKEVVSAFISHHFYATKFYFVCVL